MRFCKFCYRPLTGRQQKWCCESHRDKYRYHEGHFETKCKEHPTRDRYYQNIYSPHIVLDLEL